MPFPSLADLHEIVNRTTGGATPQAALVARRNEVRELSRLVRSVPAAAPIQDFALRLVLATHPEREQAPGEVKRYTRCGASPRTPTSPRRRAPPVACWNPSDSDESDSAHRRGP